MRQLVNVIERCIGADLFVAGHRRRAGGEQALEGENTALPTFVEARAPVELNYLRKLLQITGRATPPRRAGLAGATAPIFISCCRAMARR